MINEKEPSQNISSNSGKILEVSLDSDEMEAYLTVYDFSLPLVQIVELLKKELKARRVRSGFLRENLKKILKEKPTGVPVLIARGTPPEGVKQPQIIELKKFLPAIPIVVDTIKEIHPKQFFPTNWVFKNTPLLELKFPNPPAPGKTVTGKSIEPQIAEVVGLKLGPNVAFDKESRRIIARCNGTVTYKPHQWIDVLPFDYYEGESVPPGETLRSEKSIFISGAIKGGVHIISQKDIYVDGIVENSYLEAQGNIIISRGAVGEQEGFIQAGGNIILSFARFQALEARGNIAFRSELLHCKCFAEQKIISVGGRIIGGQSEALEKIIIQTAGNREQTPTYLKVGRKELLFEKKQKLNWLIKEHNKELRRIKKQIYDLVIKKIDNLITENELEKLERFQHNKEIIPEKMQQLETELTRINKEIEKIEMAAIEILDTIYPGVTVSIGDFSKTIETTLQRVTYTIRNEKLRELPL